MPSATRINVPIFFPKPGIFSVKNSHDVFPKQIYEIKLYDHWVFNLMHILPTVQKTQPDTFAAEIDTLLHLHFFLPAVIKS
jgi:hypothetical protein